MLARSFLSIINSVAAETITLVHLCHWRQLQIVLLLCSQTVMPNQWRDIYGSNRKSTCPSDLPDSKADYDSGYRSRRDNMCKVFVYKNNLKCVGNDLNDCLNRRCQAMFRRGKLEAFFHESSLRNTTLPAKHRDEYVATGYSIEKPTTVTYTSDKTDLVSQCNIYPCNCYNLKKCPTLMWCPGLKQKRKDQLQQPASSWYTDSAVDKLPSPYQWAEGEFPKCRNIMFEEDGPNRLKAVLSAPTECGKLEYEMFVCTFPPYLNCHKRRYQQCNFNRARNDCFTHYYITISKAVPPFGVNCPEDNLGPRCSCKCTTSEWQQWSSWSASCGTAHRKRYRPYDGTTHQCKPENPGQCCMEIEEVDQGAECTDYIYNTSMNLKKLKCVNGEMERDNRDHLMCRCHRGYHGQLCEKNMNACNSIPCKNNGTCENVGNGYICHCDGLLYTGRQCETKQSPCNETECQNGGNCTQVANFHTCNCTNEFVGAYCELEVDTCNNTVCSRRGECREIYQGKQYRCVCDHPYTGRECEQYVEADVKEKLEKVPQLSRFEMNYVYICCILVIATVCLCYLVKMRIRKKRKRQQAKTESRRAANNVE